MRTSSAARQFVTWAPFAVLLIVLLPVASAAQEPVKSFDQLNTRLKPGDTIWVTDAQGREIKGRITSLAPDTLGLDGRGATTLPADQVRVVENRRHDSLKNGSSSASWSVSAPVGAWSPRFAPTRAVSWTPGAPSLAHSSMGGLARASVLA